jgi:Winged helix DNA-binding domain
VRSITNDERRARLAVRHHLTPSARVSDVVELASDLVGLHGSDPATVFLSAAARLKQPDQAVPALERGLYEERTLVRTLCMRRTMFVVPLDVVPIVQAACTDALVPGERKRLVRMIEEHGIASNGARWLSKIEAQTVAELDAHGEATAAELSKAVPGLREKLSYGEGKPWAGTMGLSTRVLFLLSTEQRVVRGRPKGSWTSRVVHRYAPAAGPRNPDSRPRRLRRGVRRWGRRWSVEYRVVRHRRQQVSGRRERNDQCIGTRRAGTQLLGAPRVQGSVLPLCVLTELRLVLPVHGRRRGIGVRERRVPLREGLRPTRKASWSGMPRCRTRAGPDITS